MQLLTEFFEIQAKVFEFFGYVEDWRVIPLDDARKYFWRLDGEGPGTVHFADTEEELANEEGNYYTNEIYTQRHLPLAKLSLEAGEENGKQLASLLADGVTLAQETAKLIAADMLFDRLQGQCVSDVGPAHWIGTDHGPHTVRIEPTVAWHTFEVVGGELSRLEVQP